MNTAHLTHAVTLASLLAASALSASGDPILTCWQTNYAGQYARIYTNAAMQSAGTPLTTWSNGSQIQAEPAYAGAQEIYSSSNWVYVRSTGLASFTMGPWQAGFPNLPENQQTMFRIPRRPTVPATKTANGGGTIGIFVDGVAMFNGWDAFTYDPGTGADTPNYTGYWNRDAYVNEGPTFDPAYAHQQNSGTYHYHASPIALRYQLGDHVDYHSSTKTWSESTNAAIQHSPLLGWVGDGFPIYGPYGYSNATNASSGVRRMISGYLIRNGSYGTSNLTLEGRTTLPAWAVRLQTTSVGSNEPGPSVSASFPLGRYMEDNDYLGDHGYAQGVDFDLDEFNGRYCVTPEYPNGTYAYFVAISSNGTPVYPYNIGRGYYGSPTGGTVASVTDTVVTNFLGYTKLVPKLNAPVVRGGTITLSWSALEGGTYQVEDSTNLTSWNVLATGVTPNEIGADYTNSAPAAKMLYRVGRTAVATYQGAGTTTFTSSGSAGGGTVDAPGGSVNPGTTVTVRITLPAEPPNPPAGAPITSVTLAGSIVGTAVSDVASGTVLATFAIPANAPAGPQNIVVTFATPPGMGTAPTFTLVGGLTIN